MSAPDSLPRIKAPQTVARTTEDSAPYREVITGVFYDEEGERRGYAYIAVGFAHARVDAMLNPGRRMRERRFE